MMTYRRIVIAVSPSGFMRWHAELHGFLSRRWPDAEVVFRFEPREDRQPLSVTQLLALERILLRRGKPALCDRVTPPPVEATIGAAPCVLVDLIGDAASKDGERTLRPLYDGHGTDQAAIAAVLSCAAPVLAIEDAATGRILTQGLPSLEAADGLIGALDAVYSRMSILIEKALANPGHEISMAPVERPRGAPLSFLMRNLAFQSARAIYHLCCYSPHWRVGWRFNDGPGVVETGALTGAPWRVMQDREISFAADPFPIEWRGGLGVFYERFNYRTEIGEIFFQAFGETGQIGEPIPALQEPWHLSYPFIIAHDGELYMLPEASASGALTLYRCNAFPDRWEPVCRLLDGVEAADATIFRHGDRYWMTSVVRRGFGGYSDTLAIHHAQTLFGPWEPHALTPVIVDSRIVRPAGAVVASGGDLYRPVQDCTRGYGMGLSIMRIDALDPENFHQTLVHRLTSGKLWPGPRLHTLNRAGRLECIDGAIPSPKYTTLRRLVHDYVDGRRIASHS